MTSQVHSPSEDAPARRHQGGVSTRAVLAASEAILPWMVDIRRDLHQHPELGLEEFRTAERVQAHLDELGIAHEDGIGGTGVLGTLPGPAGSRAVALRADLDALPMQDAKDVPYRSRVTGKMHACGHDVHTAVLLGAARLLSELDGGVPGTVRLLFQPAEETVGGAQLLIEAGALTQPPVAAVLGLHVDSELEVGSIGVRYGQRNASSDSVKLVIHGRSVHAAYPSGGIDAVVVAAQVITAVQSIVSRNVDARESAVISFGRIQGGTQSNIMADRVELLGTVRTLSPGVRATVLERLQETVTGVAVAFGGRAEMTVEPGYPPLINDDDLVDLVRTNATELVGEDHVHVKPVANMGVEDFAYYVNEVPGAFFSLGVRNEARGIVHGEHQVGFDVDEHCMVWGAAIQVLNALTVLTR